MATPNNLPLRDLQKIILGKRKEPLSNIEIRNLFSYPTTPESILYIITALNTKKIDPNTTLIQGISNSNKKEDLVPIALALRYGADPNLYVNAPNIGDIHILGYVYLTLSKKDLALLNSVIIMLIAMGSNPHLPVFDSKGGVVRDEFSLVEPIRGQSVIGWLDDQGFNTIIHQIENQDYSEVDNTFMTMIATFLDRNDLLEQDPRLDEVIGSHSTIIFYKHSQKANKDKGLELARDYLNLTAFEFFIDQGAIPDYGEINDLVLLIETYKKIGDLISLGQIRQMLLYSISRGILIDTYQLDMIKNIDKTTYDKVNAEYSVPYWKKVCQTMKGLVPDRLKLLAYRLNLYPESSKDTLCYQIKKILQSDPIQVKKSVIERQKSRVDSMMAYINEFVDGSPPSLVCSNQSVLKNDIYDYPDVDIAFYKDDQDSLWCFSSNNFVKIMEQKKNPYTVQVFPEDFLSRVSNQIDFITKYRSIDDLPVAISETLDNIIKPDVINNEYTDKYSKLFEETMALNGITEWNIDKLSSDDMETILLNNFNVQTDLTSLSNKDHIVKTFYIISYQELLKNPDLNNSFFEQIEKKSVNK